MAAELLRRTWTGVLAVERPFCAIVGGYVVRDPGLPTLNGRYLYGDNCNGASLWSAALRIGGDSVESALRVDGLSSFGEDACGRIYVASLGSDAVYRHPGRRAVGVRHVSAAPRRRRRPPRTCASASAASRRRRLRLALTCDEACRVTINTPAAPRPPAHDPPPQPGRNQRTLVRVKMRRKVARRMRRALSRRGFVRVVMRVRVVDAAGNARVVTSAGGSAVRVGQPPPLYFSGSSTFSPSIDTEPSSWCSSEDGPSLHDRQETAGWLCHPAVSANPSAPPP